MFILKILKVYEKLYFVLIYIKKYKMGLCN